MDGELRILILEDVSTDAELVKYELFEAGISFTAKCVKTKTAFVKELAEFSPDIILSDYSLPSFDGLSALKLVSEQCPEIPFIFVSGALGEERAIELLKQGATDYVLKDRLSRLAPAVSRALQEARERAERKRVERALQESEIRYRAIFENTGTATLIIDKDANIILANRQFEKLSGYDKAHFENKNIWKDIVYEVDLDIVTDLHCLGEHGSKEYEFCIVNRMKAIRHVLATITAIPSTEKAVMSLLDITARKVAEDALTQREQDLQLKSQSLEEANTALKVLLKHREEDKSDLEEQVLINVKKLVLPYLEDLKHFKLNELQMAHVEIIEKHLHDIVSPFLRTLSSSYLDLTPREIQIANLVKEGKTTKEITELLNISATAVDFHRKNLRAKFGIKNIKTNLRSHLSALAGQV